MDGKVFGDGGRWWLVVVSSKDRELGGGYELVRFLPGGEGRKGRRSEGRHLGVKLIIIII